MSALRSLSGGKQTFNKARRICAGASRRLAKVNRNSLMAALQPPWLRLWFASVLCQFCHDDPDAVSAGFVTAKHHNHASHRSTRSFCDLFQDFEHQFIADQ